MLTVGTQAHESLHEWQHFDRNAGNRALDRRYTLVEHALKAIHNVHARVLSLLQLLPLPSGLSLEQYGNNAVAPRTYLMNAACRQ